VPQRRHALFSKKTNWPQTPQVKARMSCDQRTHVEVMFYGEGWSASSR
jgi:hypothetical protein